MIRVLHLLSTDADFQSRRTVESLRRQLGADFHLDIRTLGKAGDWRNVPAAVLALRNMNVDVIHAWSLAGLTAAVMAGGIRHILFSPNRFVGPKAIRWIRSVMAYRD